MKHFLFYARDFFLALVGGFFGAILGIFGSRNIDGTLAYMNTTQAFFLIFIMGGFIFLIIMIIDSLMEYLHIV